jgi:SAM-dependent methyltransferase
MTNDEIEILKKRWFYRFRLPSGRETECYLHGSMSQIHDTRLAMMWEALEPLLGEDWGNVRAIDIGCNQGWFSCHLAARGCAEVWGIDLRRENIDDARLIARALRRDNIRFIQSDLRDLDPEEAGPFDVVLLFGFLHRQENPIEVIRRARALTRRVCLVETQVAPDFQPTITWGSSDLVKQGHGAFVVIDTSDEVHLQSNAPTASVSLCPNLAALIWLMEKLEFKHVRAIPPPPDSYEEHAASRRVMLAGYVD